MHGTAPTYRKYTSVARQHDPAYEMEGWGVRSARAQDMGSHAIGSLTFMSRLAVLLTEGLRCRTV